MPYRSFVRESPAVMAGQTHRFPFPAHQMPIISPVLLLLPHIIPWLQGQAGNNRQAETHIAQNKQCSTSKKKKNILLGYGQNASFSKNGFFGQQVAQYFPGMLY